MQDARQNTQSGIEADHYAATGQWREHHLTPSLVARWRHYDMMPEAAFVPPEPTPSQVLEARVAELERFCGQLAYEIRGG